MVLGFGKGPERFPSAKEQTPGPGAYDPKELETKLPPKSGFLTAERFSSQELEGNPEAPPREPSPPRERKPVNPGNDRSYSWATQRIHELNKEIETANKRVKELEKLLKERVEKADKAKRDMATATAERDELQIKLHGLEQELADISDQLSEAKKQLTQVSVQEAKASRSAQAGAARVEQLLLEVQKAGEAQKQLEQLHSSLQKDAEDNHRKAEMALAAGSVLQQELGVARNERASLLDRVLFLEEQCRQREAELAEQTAERAHAEAQLASAESSLAATRADLQQTIGMLSETKAAADRSSNHVQQLLEELAAARAESSGRNQQLIAVQAELAAVQQQNDKLSSHVRTKEASLEALSAQMATQMSEVVELRMNVSNFCSNLEAAQISVKQRDTVISSLTAKNAELTSQLTDQENELCRINELLQKRGLELEAAAVREQTLVASNTQLEERLCSKVAECEQLVTSAEALRQELDNVQEDLATRSKAIAVATARLDEAQGLVSQQKLELRDQAARLTFLESELETLSLSAQDQAQVLSERADTIGQLQDLSRCKDAEIVELNVQLDAERTVLQARSEAVTQLTQTLAERDTALNSLAAELTNAKKALQERATHITQLQAEAEAAADAAIATAELINALEASLSQKKSEIIAFKSKVTELEACNAELQDSLRTEKETCAILSAELGTARAALADGEAVEASIREKLASTYAAQQEALEQCARLSSALTVVKEDHTELSRRYDALTQSEAALRLELKEQFNLHEREGAELQDKLAELQQELSAKLATAQQEAQVLQARLQDARTAAEQQAAELAQVRDHLASRSVAVEQLQLTVTNMEGAAADLEAAKVELTQMLSTTQKDLSRSVLQCSALEVRVAELEASLAEMADLRVQEQATVAQLRAENLEITAKASADAELVNARVTALLKELEDSRNAAAGLGAELAQLVTDLEGREQEIKELKVARHETCSALTAATAERADLRYQLEEMRRRGIDMQAQLTAARARGAQLEVETESLKTLVTVTQEEARQARDEAYTLSADLDKARDQIRTLQLQEIQTESLHQELEAMCSRLRDAESRNEALQDQLAAMESRVATMTPICSRAKLDDQVRALSEALEKSHMRSSELEDQVRHNVLLEHTAVLELRRLTDENGHLVTRMMKLEEDLKEQSALGHNNHKQKIQYHLRLKQELEELRHACTVLLRDKFQLEQCIRYLAVQVGMGPSDRRQALATAERKAIEKVLPACLAYSAIYSTPLSQRAMRLSARGKNNEQGTVYAGGKETFEEGISEAQRKFLSVATNLRNEFQFAAAVAAVAISSPIAEKSDAMADCTGAEAAETAEGSRPDTCGSPDGKAARDPSGSHAAAQYGTPIATIRGAGTPASGSTQGTANGGGPPSLAKLEERIKQLISDVCAPATSRNPAGLSSSGTAATDLVAAGPAAGSTLQRVATVGGARERDQDQDKHKDRIREMSSAGAGPSGNNAGNTVGNGSAGMSNAGGGGNGGGRERAPRASIAPGGEVATGSRAQSNQNRRLTTAGPSTRAMFKA